MNRYIFGASMRRAYKPLSLFGLIQGILASVLADASAPKSPYRDCAFAFDPPPTTLGPSMI